MKYIPLFLLIAFANVAQAINLTFDFTERDRMGVTGGTHQYLFDELNGTEFLGQKISLDINFSGEQFIRIFSITSQRLELHFDLYTNNYPIPYTGSGFRDLVDNVSGYVTGKNGKEIKKADPVVGGSWGGIGIFPIRNPENGGPFNPNIKTPLDIYGAHLEFTLGNYPGTYITFGGFMLNTNFEGFIPEFGTAFGIGPDYLPKDLVDYGEAVKWAQQAYQAQTASVPDAGSTLALFGIAFAAIGGLRQFQTKQSKNESNNRNYYCLSLVPQHRGTGVSKTAFSRRG